MEEQSTKATLNNTQRIAVLEALRVEDKGDIVRLEVKMDELDQKFDSKVDELNVRIGKQFQDLEVRVDRRFDSLASKLWVIICGMVGTFGALVADMVVRR